MDIAVKMSSGLMKIADYSRQEFKAKAIYSELSFFDLRLAPRCQIYVILVNRSVVCVKWDESIFHEGLSENVDVAIAKGEPRQN